MLDALLFIGLAAAYAAVKIILERKLTPLDDAGDERQLSDLAFACGISVYELFTRAGEVWNFSRRKVEEDFKRYLKQSQVPRYVREYVRQHLLNDDRTYQRLLFSGGRPPYL
ncbi:MAG: hypothetical protein ACOWWM_13820 [Desulfobacterales bacterium]